MNKKRRLYIFDVDGTLTEPKSGERFRKQASDWRWLPGRLEKLQALKAAGNFIRFASNQGGVGFGLLDEQEIINEFTTMAREIGYEPGDNIIHVCFAHPKAKITKYREESTRRKPMPGMLLEAMLRENVTADETLMVGDRPEDEEAAENAGVAFMWAHDFFTIDPNASIQTIIADCLDDMLTYDPPWQKEDMLYSACGAVLKHAEARGQESTPELMAAIQAAVRLEMDKRLAQ